MFAPYVKEIAAAVSQRYGDWDHYNRKNALEELLFILCSIQTSEELYRDTFASLRREFPSFDALANASEEQIALALVKGGLSKQKAGKIKRLLKQIADRFGKPTIAP